MSLPQLQQDNEDLRQENIRLEVTNNPSICTGIRLLTNQMINVM